MPQAKGSNAYLAFQQEGAAYAVDPTTPQTTKIYFESESISKSLGLNDSAIIRGNRNAAAPTRGTIDVTGGFTTELMAGHGLPLYGVLGSVATTANSGTGEILGTALTTPTAVIDTINQIMTVTCTAHGIAIGDVIQLAGLTAPTALNNLYCKCIAVTSVNIFVLRIPVGISATFTLGTGTLKKVTTPATTYTHTFKVGTCLPSFMAEKGFPDIGQYFKYNGEKIGKMSLDISSSGPQKMSFDLMGAKETVGTTPFATPIDLGKASFDGLALGTIEEGGTAIAIVSAISGLSFENNLDGDTFLLAGGGTRGAINEGLVKVSATIKALFQDVVLYNKALNSTESSLRMVYNRGTGAGTVGNESIEFKLPELIYSVKTPVVDKPGGLWVELGIIAYYNDSTEASTLQVILKNTQSAV
ncbi:MAG: phage tail tube protein [Deltaproteobacteria bacterium]|nr:phage tail tube protein [Deltaproteobacteria bacterium]